MNKITLSNGLRDSQVISDDDDFDPKSMLPSARGSSSPVSNFNDKNRLLAKFENNVLDISEIGLQPDPNRSTEIIIGEALSVPMHNLPVNMV